MATAATCMNCSRGSTAHMLLLSMVLVAIAASAAWAGELAWLTLLAHQPAVHCTWPAVRPWAFMTGSCTRMNGVIVAASCSYHKGCAAKLSTACCLAPISAYHVPTCILVTTTACCVLTSASPPAAAAPIIAVTNRDVDGAVVKDGSANFVLSASACQQQCKDTPGCNLWVWCGDTDGCAAAGSSGGLDKSRRVSWQPAEGVGAAPACIT